MDAIEGRPLSDRNDLTAVLSTGLDLIGRVVPRLRYRLVGTGATGLQGVDVPMGDIDLLLTRRSDVDAVAAALAHLRCVIAPHWIDVSRQYFGCYLLDGVRFSFSTLEQPCDEDGWECKGPGPWRHYVPVDLGGHRVGCVALELRLTTEFLRHRPHHYRRLLSHFGEHGADLELLRQSLTVREIPESLARLTRGLHSTGEP